MFDSVLKMVLIMELIQVHFAECSDVSSADLFNSKFDKKKKRKKRLAKGTKIL